MEVQMKSYVLTVVAISSLATACHFEKSATATLTSTEEAPLPFRLARRTYSRTIGSGLGAPAGSHFTHSIQFVNDNYAIDNGPAFFGNPPLDLVVNLEGHKLTLSSAPTHVVEVYTVSQDGLTLTSDDGARVLKVDPSTLPQNKTEVVLETLESDLGYSLGNGSVSFQKVNLDSKTDAELQNELVTEIGNRPDCKYEDKASPKTDISYFTNRILELNIQSWGDEQENKKIKDDLSQLDVTKALSRELSESDDISESCPVYAFSLLTKDGYQLTLSFGFDD